MPSCLVSISGCWCCVVKALIPLCQIQPPSGESPVGSTRPTTANRVELAPAAFDVSAPPTGEPPSAPLPLPKKRKSFLLLACLSLCRPDVSLHTATRRRKLRDTRRGVTPANCLPGLLHNHNQKGANCQVGLTFCGVAGALEDSRTKGGKQIY